MRRGGLLSLKDTEIDTSALKEAHPITEATNLSRTSTQMLAFTMTFTLIAYQEISSPVFLLTTPGKSR